VKRIKRITYTCDIEDQGFGGTRGSGAFVETHLSHDQWLSGAIMADRGKSNYPIFKKEISTEFIER